MVYVGVRLLRPIYQQTPLLVLAYVVLFLPLAVAAVRASVEHSPVRAEEVARSLGLDRWATLRRVTLPLAAPGLAAGAAMVFLTTMKELPATLLLHPTGTETLATMLWRFMLVSDYSSAAPYAALIVLGAALPAVAAGPDRTGGGLRWVTSCRCVALALSFGAQRVLSGVDLDVPTGRVVALVGPSGCGKTTLVRLVAGFQRPDAGHDRARRPAGRLGRGPGGCPCRPSAGGSGSCRRRGRCSATSTWPATWGSG